MILFKKLRYKNFLSTGNIFTEIDLNTHNTVLIIGDNGSGKSTILDALSFVLFGKAFRNINKPQLINSINQKHMVVEVEFSIGLYDYKIIRGMKPVVFEVYRNGTLLNQSAESKDYQEILEKQIIKANHKSFCQIVILGSATFKPFMQLSAAGRREIIEDLLDLQIFTTMNVLLKDKIQINNDYIYQNVHDKKLVEEKMKLIHEHIDEMQQKDESLIVDKQEKIEETNKQIEAYEVELQELNTKKESIEDSLVEEASIQKKIKKMDPLIHQITAKINVNNHDIKFLKDHDNCPTCKQLIDEKFKCDSIESKLVNLKELQNGLNEIGTQYSELEDRLKKFGVLSKELNDVKFTIYTVKTKLTSAKVYIDQLENEITVISDNKKSMDISKINDLEKELFDLKDQYGRLIEDKQLFAVASTLLKDSGIKSKIIKQYIPIINKLINKYLSTMEFMCDFILNEEFDEKILSRYRDEFSYESFSEGEKFRINLSILFTWRAVAKLRNSINTNLLLMDEVMDSSLDNNGTEEFLKIINNLSNETNVIIISHKNDQISDKFEKVIRFEKHKNFSTVAA